MTTQWDRSVDLVIAGSGGGGMVARHAAVEDGDRDVRKERPQRQLQTLRISEVGRPGGRPRGGGVAGRARLRS